MGRNGDVLLLHGGMGDAQRYRCLHLQEQLSLYGVTCDVCEFRNQELRTPQSDVIIFHRVPLDGYIQRLIAHLRQSNKIILFDADDLVFDEASFPYLADLAMQNRARAELYKEEIRNYRRTLDESHAALVATNFLAERVRALRKPAWVHRNAFSAEMLALAQRAEKPRSNGIVIGYASGTPTHNRDFAQIKPVLKQILVDYPKAELHIVGHLDMGDDWGLNRDRVRQFPFVPWRELPNRLAQFDINIAPLEITNPFCQAKSELKYIEASLVHVPTIASATDSFCEAIRSGENGMLAKTNEEWGSALWCLIDDANLRDEMGEQAYQDVIARYHPSVRAQELVTTLNQFSQSFYGKTVFPDSPRQDSMRWTSSISAVESIPPLWRRIVYVLHYRGIYIFWLQTFVFIQTRASRFLLWLMSLFSRAIY